MQKKFSFLWLAFRRLLTSLVYKVKREFSLPIKPIFINFSATYRCNSRCLMCNNWQRYQKDPQKVKEELTVADWEKIFKRDKDWFSSVRHFGIAGGEPFLKTDLVELVRLIHKDLPKVKIGLQTNGLEPKIIALKLKEILSFCPGITLAVSIDGMEKTHDKVRGVKGSFRRVLETVRIAHRLGIKEITAGMTVVKENHREITEVIERMKKLGIEVSFYPADQGEYYHTERKENRKDQVVVKSLVNTLEKFPGDYFKDNLRRILLGSSKRSLPCYSGWTSLVLDPYGEIKPCVLRSESLGNLKKEPLAEILTSSKAEKIRKEIKKCSCFSLCEVSTSAVIDPWDVVFWFLFKADKKTFLQKAEERLKAIS